MSKLNNNNKNNNLNECVNSSIVSGANTNKMEEQKKKVPDVDQIDFNDNWNLSKIDNKTKLILFQQNSKFTKTLESILENDLNLNIIFEDNDKCVVYLKKSLVVVESKIIYTKIMDKLYKLLCEFYSDLSTPNIFDINPSIYDSELTILKIKYDSYVKDQELQGKVNAIIKFIYDKKKERTAQIFI
jgi:hypothetical protein